MCVLGMSLMKKAPAYPGGGTSVFTIDLVHGHATNNGPPRWLCAPRSYARTKMTDAAFREMVGNTLTCRVNAQ